MSTYTITVPGKFAGYFDGTGIGQGEDVSDCGARNLYESWKHAESVKRGHGYSVVLGNLTLDGIALLAEYAEFCLCANSDEPDHAEVAAARRVFALCSKPMKENGWRWSGYSWFPPGEVIR